MSLEMLHNPIVLAGAGSALAFIGLLWVVIRRVRRADKSQEIRAAAMAGEYRRAGDLQLGRGNLQEAYNLYARGVVHDRASDCAERLGRSRDAARHAEAGGDYPRAARLYESLGDLAAQAEALSKAGRAVEAARVADADPDASASVRARRWDVALCVAQAEAEEQPSPQKETVVRELATRARAALLRAGDETRADAVVRSARGRKPTPARAVPTRDVPADHGAPDAAAQRYQLGPKQGQGGRGVVYRAHDTVLDRPVALKFLPETLVTDKTAQSMFDREARAAAALTHPNVVVIYDFGVRDGRPFLSLELVEGDPLTEVLGRDGDPGLLWGVWLEVAQGLFRALACAREQGIVHRDIKPANILLSRRGEVKLTDFGVAKILDTQPGSSTIVAGTPPYMSPEQLEGTNIDHRTDLFAAGVTLYELWTGELPFDGVRRDRPPVPPGAHRAGLPHAIEQLVTRCLEFDPKARPQDAQTAVDLLDAAPADLCAQERPISRPRPRLEYAMRRDTTEGSAVEVTRINPTRLSDRRKAG